MKKKLICIITVLVLALAVCCFAFTACGEEEPELTSIKVTKAPAKTSYVEGQSLDLSGMTVKAYYGDTDKTGTVITDYTVDIANGTKLDTTGKVTITVTYLGKTATTTVNVEAKKIISLNVVSGPNSFVPAVDYKPVGLSLKAEYNDGEQKDVDLNDCTVEKTGYENDVKVSYQGMDVVLPLEDDDLGVANVEGCENGADISGKISFWNPAHWVSYTDITTGGVAPTYNSESGELTFTSATNSRFDLFRVGYSDNGTEKWDNIGANVKNFMDDQPQHYTFNVKATGEYGMLLLVNKSLPSNLSGGAPSQIALGLYHRDGVWSMRSIYGGFDNDLAVASEMLTPYDKDDFNKIDLEFTRKENIVTIKVYVNSVRLYFTDVNMSAQPGGKLENGNFCFGAGTLKADGSSSGYHNFGHRFSIKATGDATVTIKKVDEGTEGGDEGNEGGNEGGDTTEPTNPDNGEGEDGDNSGSENGEENAEEQA